MKILILLPFFFVSCASYVHTLGTRMISPEAHGGLGKGAMELRLQAAKRDKLNFDNDKVNNSIKRDTTVHVLTGQAEIGFFERLDLFILPALDVSPTIFGTKYQFIGEPKSAAKKDNFSSSIMIGYGHNGTTRTSSGDLNDILNQDIDKIEVNTLHYEIGMIAGYRWSEKFLHYANTIYLREEVDGKITTDSGSLTSAPFKYSQDGMIYSTGFILYFAKAQLKLDYSHFTSDWSRTGKHSANTVSTALGFNW